MRREGEVRREEGVGGGVRWGEGDGVSERRIHLDRKWKNSALGWFH